MATLTSLLPQALLVPIEAWESPLSQSPSTGNAVVRLKVYELERKSVHQQVLKTGHLYTSMHVYFLGAVYLLGAGRAFGNITLPEVPQQQLGHGLGCGFAHLHTSKKWCGQPASLLSPALHGIPSTEGTGVQRAMGTISSCSHSSRTLISNAAESLSEASAPTGWLFREGLLQICFPDMLAGHCRNPTAQSDHWQTGMSK